MRILGLILAAAVAGATIGAAVAYVETRPGGGVAAGPTASSGESAAPAGAAPRVEVAEPLYEFGAMQRGTTKSHEFSVRNAGQSPLTLRVGSTTCKCTIGNVSNDPIPPGESVMVKLEWSALVNPGPFRQTATILTNDPRSSAVELLVEGEVTDATGIFPPDFMLDKITAGATKSAEVYVMMLAQA